MEPSNPVFLHTQAEVARKRANRESSPVLKEQLRRLARQFLNRIPKGGRFAVSSRCKLLVDEVADLSETLSEYERVSEDRFFAEKLKETELALARAQQDFPDDPEMFETEARLWSEMKDKDRALKALERAWKKVPRGSGTAIRIGKIYAAAGRADDQFAILKDALSRESEDKATHFAMAMHLLEKEAPDCVEAERHLINSFSSDDQNFEARYTLAQFLFAKGNVDGAVEIFSDIYRRAPQTFRRFAPKQDSVITIRLPTYSGSIESVREGFCFIRSGAYPNRIYAHRSAFNDIEADEIEVGQEVNFRIRFNRSGPVAVGVHLKFAPK